MRASVDVVRRMTVLAVGALALLVMSCAPRVPIDAASCFGAVGYSFEGWTSLRELGVADDPARIYALVTSEEIVLDVSPPGQDGGTWALMGRGLCYVTESDPSVVMKSAFGPTERVER